MTVVSRQVKEINLRVGIYKASHAFFISTRVKNNSGALLIGMIHSIINMILN